MGNVNIKPQVDQNIIKLYNLFNEESLFYKNSKKSFCSLCKTVYNKDLDKQNSKLINLPDLCLNDFLLSLGVLTEFTKKLTSGNAAAWMVDGIGITVVSAELPMDDISIKNFSKVVVYALLLTLS